MAKKKAEAKKTSAEKLARQAGKVAAQAEKTATEAVDRAKALTSFLADFFGKPIGAAVQAGQERIGQFSAGVSHLLSGDGRGGSGDGAIETVKEAVEDRLRSIVHEIGLPTRDEYENLKARLAELEAAAAKPARKQLKAKPAATATKVTAKPAAKPAAKVAKPAAKPAAKVAKPAAKPAAKVVKPAAKPAARLAKPATKPSARLARPAATASHAHG